MKILGLDTSGLVAGVAVVEDQVLLGEYTVDYKKTHSQTLLPMLEELKKMLELDPDTLDAIAVASGPGSFTGLRIGSATAKGLGLALKKPLVEVPTLEGLAWNLWGSSRLVCPMMDARRNQVYTMVCEFVPQGEGFGFQTLVPGQPMNVEELAARLNAFGRETIFLGDGVSVYLDILKKTLKVPYRLAPAHCNRQRAACIAALGEVYFSQGKTVTAAEHTPRYFRKSQADMDLEKAKRDSKIEIRELRSEDIEQVSRIEAASFGMPWSAEAFRDLLDKPGRVYLVALWEGQVVGNCGYTESCREANIDNVVVAEEFRGRGIAQAMLEKLMETGDGAGITAYTLEVRVSNQAAIHIYEKFGFRSEGIRPGFYEKPVEDAMIMWKR